MPDPSGPALATYMDVDDESEMISVVDSGPVPFAPKLAVAADIVRVGGFVLSDAVGNVTEMIVVASTSTFVDGVDIKVESEK